MGKVKVFVWVFFTLHIKGDILIIGEKKKTGAKHPVLTPDFWATASEMSDKSGFTREMCEVQKVNIVSVSLLMQAGTAELRKKGENSEKNTLDRLTRERIWAPIMKPTMIQRARGAEISPTITRRRGNAGGGLNSTNTCKGLLRKPNPSWAGSLG